MMYLLWHKKTFSHKVAYKLNPKMHGVHNMLVLYVRNDYRSKALIGARIIECEFNVLLMGDSTEINELTQSSRLSS